MSFLDTCRYDKTDLPSDHPVPSMILGLFAPMVNDFVLDVSKMKVHFLTQCFVFCPWTFVDCLRFECLHWWMSFSLHRTAFHYTLLLIRAEKIKGTNLVVRRYKVAIRGANSWVWWIHEHGFRRCRRNRKDTQRGRENLVERGRNHIDTGGRANKEGINTMLYSTIRWLRYREVQQRGSVLLVLINRGAT